MILTKVPIDSQAFTFAKTLQMSNLLAGRTDDKIWEIRGASTHRSVDPAVFCLAYQLFLAAPEKFK